MGREDFLYKTFLSHLDFDPTSCQDNLFHEIADFISTDDGDIMVINGYAGTGKTSAMAAVVSSMKDFEIPCILLAPTGRSAKVLSLYTNTPAYTIHKHIYRQKSIGEDGFGLFSLSHNKAKEALFIVDEVSLIGIDVQNAQSTSLFGSGNLLEDLISFVRNGHSCRLILVGDSAQLPPIGMDKSPALSKEYMSMFGGVRFASLTTVVRHQMNSGILRNATYLRTLLSSGQSAAYDMSSLNLVHNGYDDVEVISGAELLECLSDAYDKYGEEETMVLCRSNKRANRYNSGIRSRIQYREEKLEKGEKLMIVKNCYQFVEDVKDMDYIANGDIAYLEKLSRHEERYGLHFAEAKLRFPDYGGQEITAKVCLDVLDSETASLTYEQQNNLYQGVMEDYSYLSTKKKRYDAVREDPFYNALQLKYANAITCHKSQGGQWKCVFVDNPFWQDELVEDDLKWLYTAITRAVEKVYLVNFRDECFE